MTIIQEVTMCFDGSINVGEVWTVKYLKQYLKEREVKK